MKKIIIKEIDILTSKKHKNRIIIEYLIYLMENDVKLACYNEIGIEAKNIRVNDILISEFNISEINYNLENIIQEVSF